MLDYLRLLFQLIFAVSVMYMLLDCKDKMKKDRFKVGAFALAVILCDTIVFHHLGYTRFLSLYPVLVQLPVLLTFLYVSKFNPIKVLFVHLTVVAITLSITAVGLFAAYYFKPSKLTVNIVCYILYLPVGYLIYKYIRQTFLYMLQNTDKGWIGFCIIPLSYTLLLYSISSFNLNFVATEPITWTAILYFVLVIAAYYMIFRYFKLTREQLTMRLEQDLLMAQVSAAQIHLADLKESQEKAIIYRHDMRHHLKLIDSYLADNNKAAAQKYIAEVGEAIEETVVEQYCGNYTLNLILSSYLTRARNENIKFYTQIELPEKSGISDMDLCVVFANVIENAINACKCISNIEERSLSIICKNRGDKLLIQITNSYDGSVEFFYDLPISVIENHGFGIKSIVAVVQKYDGVYSFAAADGVFSTNLII